MKTTTNNSKRAHASIKIITGGILFILAGALWFVSHGYPEVAPTTPPHTGTTTDPLATEPIVPQARVSTEGWKTCRNEEYGWELKYPAKWYISSKDGCLGWSVSLTDSAGNDGGERWIEPTKRKIINIQETYQFRRPGIHDFQKDKADLAGLERLFLFIEKLPYRTIIAGREALYVREESNSDLGVTTTVFLVHPNEQALELSFYNVDNATINTVLFGLTLLPGTI